MTRIRWIEYKTIVAVLNEINEMMNNDECNNKMKNKVN